MNFLRVLKPGNGGIPQVLPGQFARNSRTPLSSPFQIPGQYSHQWQSPRDGVGRWFRTSLPWESLRWDPKPCAQVRRTSSRPL